MELRQLQKTSASGWADHGLFEYFLVANPDGEVYNKLMSEKQSFCDRFGEKNAIRTKPYLTIAVFQARESMEDTIIRYMQRICCRQQSFKVSLSNYSGDTPHTIYLRVHDTQPFKQIATELLAVSNYIDSCACPRAKLIANPSISIAPGLSEKVYFQALIEYSYKTFQETFMVNELVLMRRSNEYDGGKIINIFRLQPAQKSLLSTQIETQTL